MDYDASLHVGVCLSPYAENNRIFSKSLLLP